MAARVVMGSVVLVADQNGRSSPQPSLWPRARLPFMSSIISWEGLYECFNCLVCLRFRLRTWPRYQRYDPARQSHRVPRFHRRLGPEPRLCDDRSDLGTRGSLSIDPPSSFTPVPRSFLLADA